jgi:hypothetical protein
LDDSIEEVLEDFPRPWCVLFLMIVSIPFPTHNRVFAAVMAGGRRLLLPNKFTIGTMMMMMMMGNV